MISGRIPSARQRERRLSLLARADDHMVGHVGAAHAATRHLRNKHGISITKGFIDNGSAGSAQKAEMFFEPDEDHLVLLTDKQGALKLVADQSKLYLNIRTLGKLHDLPLGIKGLVNLHGSTLQENAKIALGNMHLLNECLLEIANKVQKDGGEPIRDWRQAQVPDTPSEAAVDCLKDVDSHLEALCANMIKLGRAIGTKPSAHATQPNLWQQYRPAPSEGNERQLALANIMNQRRLNWNVVKAGNAVEYKAGHANLQHIQATNRRLERSAADAVRDEAIVLQAKPPGGCCSVQ